MSQIIIVLDMVLTGLVYEPVTNVTAIVSIAERNETPDTEDK